MRDSNVLIVNFSGEFPWMVAILKEELAAEQVLNVYQCGGSLIHPSVVLTGKKNISALLTLVIVTFLF